MVTKRDITNISLHLFASKGFRETTMENIADALGIKKQSIYSHFKSKNDIISSVLREQADQINTELDIVFTEYSEKPIDMLLKFLFTRLVVFLSRRDRLLLWKRVLLLDSTGNIKELYAHDTWSFHGIFLGTLGRILRARYPGLINGDKLQDFFLSYMIFTQGYLDWMLISGYDVNTIDTSWNSFWTGARSFFI